MEEKGAYWSMVLATGILLILCAAVLLLTLGSIAGIDTGLAGQDSLLAFGTLLLGGLGSLLLLGGVFLIVAFLTRDSGFGRRWYERVRGRRERFRETVATDYTVLGKSKHVAFGMIFLSVLLLGMVTFTWFGWEDLSGLRKAVQIVTILLFFIGIVWMWRSEKASWSLLLIGAFPSVFVIFSPEMTWWMWAVLAVGVVGIIRDIWIKK